MEGGHDLLPSVKHLFTLIMTASSSASSREPSSPSSRDTKGHTHGRPPPTGGFINWAQRVNDRWIVHQGLNDSARAYMESLAGCDPARLERVCRLAWKLVGMGKPGEDPKPLFYGGLFSLCTPEEEERYLANHLFTLLTHPARGEEELTQLTAAKNIGPTTYERALRLRDLIRSVLVEDAAQSESD